VQIIMKSNITTLFFIILMLFRSEAQNPVSFYSFKGFHVGVTGEFKCIQKSNYISLHNVGSLIDLPPRGRCAPGWGTGIEFSYHFAKYFGINIGINYGTALAYNYDIYYSTVPYDYGWVEENRYERLRPTLFNEMQFPIKLEFHYPLCKDLFFMAETGVNIRGVALRLNNEKGTLGDYFSGLSFLVKTPSGYIEIMYYDQWAERDMSKIYCDLLIGIGLYYKLPYGDLLRFTTGVNLSFSNTLQGEYLYHRTGNYGTFSVKNDFIYTQLSYIHTLNWQKAKKYLKKQEYSFSSKQERRKKIIELLSNYLF